MDRFSTGGDAEDLGGQDSHLGNPPSETPPAAAIPPPWERLSNQHDSGSRRFSEPSRALTQGLGGSGRFGYQITPAITSTGQHQRSASVEILPSFSRVAPSGGLPRSQSSGFGGMNPPAFLGGGPPAFLGRQVDGAIANRLPRASHSMPLDVLLEDGPADPPPPGRRTPFLEPIHLPSHNPFLAPGFVADPAQTPGLAPPAGTNPTVAPPALARRMSLGGETSNGANQRIQPRTLRPWQSFDEASLVAEVRLLEALKGPQRWSNLGPSRAPSADVSADASGEAKPGEGARDLGSVWQSFEEPHALVPATEGGEYEGEEGQVSKKGWLRLPKGLSSWLLIPKVSPPQKPLSKLKTTVFAIWAVAIMGVVPWVNTITNAWFLAILYQPKVLDCINFVEQSPGADPSEFPTISGDLLQALSWICVLLGCLDIADLTTRLVLHLRREGVPLWRVKLLVWTTIKWLMREDDESTCIEGYTHARFREFIFSAGADTIEVFVTASFLFWTGSGYPLATFSLFISLTSVYLSWSFEISWHLWYLGRRFSPIWPHPTAGVAPDDSTAQLLRSRSKKKKKRWFWDRRNRTESGRNAPEVEQDPVGKSSQLAPAGGEVEGMGQGSGEGRWLRKETRLQRVGSLQRGSQSARFSRGAGEVALGERTPRETEGVNVAVLDMSDYYTGPVSDPVRVRDRISAQEADSVTEVKQQLSDQWGDGLVQPDQGSRDGSSRTAPLERACLERGYSSEVHELTEAADGRPSGTVRNRRSRSLEEMDVELGIIRTLSEVTETRQVSAGSALNPNGSPGAWRPSGRKPGLEPVTEVSALVSENPASGPEVGRNDSGVSSVESRGGVKPPRKRMEVGKRERLLFRGLRGCILLGMIAALIISLWLADFGPGVIYGVGITYLTRISTQIHVRCEPFDAPGTFVDYLVPFNGSQTLDLNGVFFYYTAASNAYIFDTSDDELNSITEHDFVIGALTDRFISYDFSGIARNLSAGALKVRFATVLRGVAMLVTSSDAWAKNLSDGHTVPVGKKQIPPYVPINQRTVFNYDVSAWQTKPVALNNFSVPVFCRSPYRSATQSPLGRLISLNASIGMAGVSCYNPGNATFTLPPKRARQGKTSLFY